MPVFDPLATPPRVLLANHYPFRPGEEIGPVRSESDLFLICVAGGGRITVDGQLFTVSPGFILHVPLGWSEQYLANRQAPMVLIGVHVAYQSWDAPAPGPVRHHAHPLRLPVTSQPTPFPDVFVCHDAGSGVIELAVHLADNAERTGAWAESVRRATLALFIDRLRELYDAQHGNGRASATNKDLKSGTRQHSLVRELESWMGLQLARPITRAELARRAGVSESTLAAAFRAITGRGPIDRLIDLRVERACHRLRTSSVSIASIAAEVGIPDPHYLARVVRARTGRPPRAHRRHMGDSFI